MTSVFSSVEILLAAQGGGLPLASDGGSHFYTMLVVAAVVVFLLYVFVSYWGKKISQEFADDVVHSIASAIKKDLNCGEEELEQAVGNLLVGQPASIDTGLLKVTCALEKISASQCRRTLEIYTSVGENYKRYVVESTIPWEQLPAEERKHFIMTNETSVSYDIYDKSST